MDDPSFVLLVRPRVRPVEAISCLLHAPFAEEFDHGRDELLDAHDARQTRRFELAAAVAQRDAPPLDLGGSLVEVDVFPGEPERPADRRAASRQAVSPCCTSRCHWRKCWQRW